MNAFFTTIIDTFWPHYCILCKSPAQTNIPICSYCEAELSLNVNACLQCAIPIDETETVLCGACLKTPPSFNYTFAPLIYESPINRFVSALKFHEKLLYSRMLAQLFLRHFMMRKSLSLPELIIPVPLHVKRLHQRGFNQALEIAKPISKQLNIPIDYSTCIRTKNTVSQTELPRKKRHSNMVRAFKLTKPLTAKHVAIMDDVVTTGSTTNALAKALKHGGVEMIEVWCCARTEINRGKL